MTREGTSLEPRGACVPLPHLSLSLSVNTEQRTGFLGLVDCKVLIAHESFLCCEASMTTS